MYHRGINYDVGTNYEPGYLSRETWSFDLMEREIKIIANELFCNSIVIYGSDIQRLQLTAETALKNGLYVWLQPRLINANPSDMLDHLRKLALLAEQLRRQYQKVTLNVGCELSIFMSGIIPGHSYAVRASRLLYLWPFLPLFNLKLNKHLKKAVDVARENFQGKISYGSGIWESVDWSGFDRIGLNYYREKLNQKSYVNDLRSFHKWHKPIVITEFGCCTYKGAEKKGGSGDNIVDWYNMFLPKLKSKAFIRDEKIQADYLAELISIYLNENIYGAFVFQFIEPSYTYSDDPLYDLDMASYAIVKSFKDKDAGYWETKMAFEEIARQYKLLDVH